MQIPSSLILALTTLAASSSLVSSLSAQGTLTPPGNPAPTMKTLQEIEPRVDVATLPGDASNTHIIDQPGSYYLTGAIEVSLAQGIDIRTRGVTLDLGGFSIRRTSGSGGNGIEVSGSSITCVSIKNGSVEGFGNGVFLNSASGCRLSHLSIQGGTKGILMNGTCRANLIQQCTITETGGDGIAFTTNGGTASRNLIQGCTVTEAGANGIHLDASGTGNGKGNAVRSCTIAGTTNDGIRLSGGNAHLNGNILSESTINSSSGNGVQINAFAAFAHGNLLSGLNISKSSLDGVALVSPSAGSVNGNLIEDITVGDPGSSYVSLEVLQTGSVDGNWIRNCVGRESGTIGIDVNGGNYNRIEDNHLTRTPPFIIIGSTYAIRTTNCAKNYLWRNSETSYNGGYLFDPDDTFGQLITSSGYLGNTGSHINPKANFSR